MKKIEKLGRTQRYMDLNKNLDVIDDKINEIIDAVEARPQSPCEHQPYCEHWDKGICHCQPTECTCSSQCRKTGCECEAKECIFESQREPESKECKFDFSKMSPGVQCQRCSIKPCGKTCTYAVSTLPTFSTLSGHYVPDCRNCGLLPKGHCFDSFCQKAPESKEHAKLSHCSNPIGHPCKPECRCNFPVSTTSSVNPSSDLGWEDEPWVKYHQKWLKQGRTAEQSFGVTNFMTGQGAIMLKDLLSQSIRKAQDKQRQEYDGIFKWLLGEYDFPARKEGEGAYWWRTELRKKLSRLEKGGK